MVNNCAAAVLLAVSALGGPRPRGGGVARAADRDRRRLPDAGGGRAGRARAWSRSARRTARGWPTTRRAIGPETGAILRAHPSNFRTVGFVEEVRVEALCALGAAGDRRRRLRRARRRARAAGGRAARAARRCARARRSCAFSGDKLLGGPAGRDPRRAPGGDRGLPCGIRSRARSGSTSCRWRRSRRRCALYRDPALARSELPVLAMLTASEAELRATRASALRRGDRRRGDRGGRACGRRRAAAARAARAGRSRSIRDRRAPTSSRARCGCGDPPVVGAHRARAACCSTRARCAATRLDAWPPRWPRAVR